MQYRTAAWAGVATQFAWGFMFLMIYEAFYKSSTAAPSMSYSQLASYIWLQQAFLAIIMLWTQDNELLSSITNGDVAYELCRPYGVYPFWFAKLLATRVSNAALRCLPILIIAALIPKPYRMVAPASLPAFLLFLGALIFSLVLIITISMYIYILTFLTMPPIGARLLVGVSAEFLGGSIIPIPFMPKALQTIVSFFPFRYTTDLPFRIYSGSIPPAEALTGIGIQILWILLLGCTGYFMMASVLKKTVIQGG
jgi:ABC-2 type transport system permease protein